jgi:hypothetical protein
MDSFAGLALLNRMRGWVACLLAALLVMSPPAVRAQPTGGTEASLWCINVILTEIGEAMTACGDRLDDAREATRVDLRASLKKLISEYAQLEYWASPAHDERLRAEYERKSRAGFCQGQDYQEMKALLLAFLTEQSAMGIRKRIESRVDPREGTCL